MWSTGDEINKGTQERMIILSGETRKSYTGDQNLKDSKCSVVVLGVV